MNINVNKKLQNTNTTFFKRNVCLLKTMPNFNSNLNKGIYNMNVLKIRHN